MRDTFVKKELQKKKNLNFQENNSPSELTMKNIKSHKNSNILKH